MVLAACGEIAAHPLEVVVALKDFQLGYLRQDGVDLFRMVSLGVAFHVSTAYTPSVVPFT